MQTVHFDTSSVDSYRQFLAVRRLPVYSFRGTAAEFPDEYAAAVTGESAAVEEQGEFGCVPGLFDYQRDIAQTAFKKRKYAVFADCGLGKTLIILEFARHAWQAVGKKVLIVAPLMVCRQHVQEAAKWYRGFSGLSFGRCHASELGEWLDTTDGAQIAVTNYEAIKDSFPTHNIAGLILDESSMLKSHYGAWGQRLIEMGRGLPYKLCATGTPAPNDRIEYANHAVFLDRHRTTNEFLAKYFINRGQTQNRWEIKPHALTRFYRDLSDWCIFLNNPATYGWSDNVGVTPPIHIHIDEVELTPEQRQAAQLLTGDLITANVGGIGQRGKLSQIAKGKDGIPTNKPAAIRRLVDSWPDESTIIWCHYNAEQEQMAVTFPEAVSISGDTPESERERGIDDFIAGRVRVLITKPKILGFGLNLQIATRQVFSGLKDSYEEFYQAVKRSNRIGSTRPLNVHIPVTELEMPFVDNVLQKARRVERDTEEQESLFSRLRWCGEM